MYNKELSFDTGFSGLTKDQIMDQLIQICEALGWSIAIPANQLDPEDPACLPDELNGLFIGTHEFLTAQGIDIPEDEDCDG